MKKIPKNLFFSFFLATIIIFFSSHSTEAKRFVPPNYTPSHSSSLENLSTETERKFLIDPSDLYQFDFSQMKIYKIVQTYINYDPEIRVRQVNQHWYWFALKTPKDSIGLSRSELEFPITKNSYQDLVQKQVGQTIYKTRYQFKQDDYDCSVDIYSGDLKGLAVVEVEFNNIEEANLFQPPSWFGKEVTSDLRYKNAGLAKNGKPDPDQ